MIALEIVDLHLDVVLYLPDIAGDELRVEHASRIGVT